MTWELHGSDGHFEIQDMEESRRVVLLRFCTLEEARIMTTAPELFEELDRLAGEVRGCWGMAERALREIIGNTNYHIVEERLESSRVAVAKALGRKP